MEKHFVFYTLCYTILFHLLPYNEATPWARRQCEQVAKGYDCSDMNLQVIPNEIPNSVQILTFSFNYLPALYNFTFQRLTSLNYLDLTRQVDLSENKLVKLSTSGFYSLHFLQLNFASNAIVTVDVGSVMDLGNNSTVDLSYNPL
ncbi:hypothetical protein cypCar_00035962, partial [Cyprinus carpio]